ncbi:VOC family protein [Heyndrickxia acidicola]|uniref:VOC family protein n=1 Tax=Heyndrickxia acidicola TaxID=209389 RepID=A0ABU6MLF9_9BACI|nr:VOC family protein [Heyndrickxia acidicola]MED1205519.1 VOC family protein [Heyndrickxia acidicola]
MEKVKKAVIDSSLTFLLVSNLKASQEYYRTALGCEVTEFWAIRDDFGLGFKLIEANDPGDIHPNKGTWNTYAYVKDFAELDSLYDEFKSNGAIIASKPAVSAFDWGLWKEFSVLDPDGYAFGFGTANKTI